MASVIRSLESKGSEQHCQHIVFFISFKKRKKERRLTKYYQVMEAPKLLKALIESRAWQVSREPPAKQLRLGLEKLV